MTPRRPSWLGRRLGLSGSSGGTLDAMAEPRAGARALGALYIAGALLAFTAMTVEGASIGAGLYVVYSLAVVLGIALVAAGERLPALGVWVALAVAAVLVDLGMLLSEGRLATYALFLVAIGVLAFLLLSRVAALAVIAVIWVGYAVVLAVEQPPAGREQWIVTAGTVLVVGILVGYVRSRLEAQIESRVYLADHDEMTGLPNRRRFKEELERRVAAARESGLGFALIVLDLDNLKHVNDALGHAAGDELIVQVARLLRRTLHEPDVAARLGGDEFAALLPGADSRRAEEVARELVRSVRSETALFEVHGGRASASAGVAVLEGDAEVSAEQLMIEADLATYEAKEGGRDRSALYHRDREQPGRARLDWVSRIRSALDEDRFVIYTQPIVDLRDERPVGHEVLVRMLDERGGLVPPAAFLPVAERFGLVESIDRLVVRRAVALIAEHAAAGSSLALNVNVSARSLSDPDMVPAVERELDEAGVEPDCLTFEVTETAAIASIADAKASTERLAELGCHFALDDFGAGFGSLYYLKHLPFEIVKIDGEFVRDLPRSQADQVVVRSLVELVRGLGKRTIAEFVEDRETLELLRRIGVDYAQGYHLRRPHPAAELVAGPTA